MGTIRILKLLKFFSTIRQASQKFSNSLPVKISITIEEDEELRLNNLIHCFVQLELAF